MTETTSITDELIRAAFIERVKRALGNGYADGLISDASTEEDVAELRAFEDRLKAAQTVGQIIKACRDSSWDYPSTMEALVEALIPEAILRKDEFEGAPGIYDFDT
jgi:hypothetical protein